MKTSKSINATIIIPVYNEARSLAGLLQQIVNKYPEFEVIVVNDGSTDDTISVAEEYNTLLVTHPYNMGNGAAIKSGARAASGDVLIMMDADGQHPVDIIDDLIIEYHKQYDMVVAARRRNSQANIGRYLANSIYNWLASKIVGHQVKDLTSGFRLVERNKFLKFLYMLPNGFSYPTTITMAFFKSGYTVSYIPFEAPAREGSSHIRPINDGIRFLLIIFRVATLYSPLKLFFPASLLLFLVGSGYGLFTLIAMQRFTNMSIFLLLAGFLVFLFGLLAEQITFLLYKK